MIIGGSMLPFGQNNKVAVKMLTHQRNMLYSAVKKVGEWELGYCIWCDAKETEGHTDTCERKEALEGLG